MDALDRSILNALRDDARCSMRKLARRVHLSAPAVAQRVRRLEDAGVIVGYTARIAEPAAAFSTFIELTMRDARHAQLAAFVERDARIRAAYRTSGAACYLLRIDVASAAELDAVVAEIAVFGAWRAATVIATLAERERRS